MEWSNPNKGKLRKVLLVVYPTIRELKRFVGDHFDIEFTDIGESSPENWAYDILEKAAAEGWIDQFYQTFCSNHPIDSRIAQLRADLGDPLLERTIGSSASGCAIVSVEEEEGLVEDPGAAHLVIAMFWEGVAKQKLRIHAKLCYRDPASQKVEPIALVKDDCPPILLKEFPDVLRELVDFTVNKLTNLFLEQSYPWKLTIDLFVPVDLLGQPLSTWCGQHQDLIGKSMVIGCSDRFNQSVQRAPELYNQLRRGWQRFQKQVPDQKGVPLKNLEWLNSDVAHQESFEKYSGFQCYGDWLKPDEQSLRNWLELVQSGIPLALWMCEGKTQRSELVALFEQLIDRTRFGFIDHIPILRTEQRKTSGHCVGVFYEDPAYVPDMPLPKEEQYFSWPGA